MGYGRPPDTRSELEGVLRSDDGDHTQRSDARHGSGPWSSAPTLTFAVTAPGQPRRARPTAFSPGTGSAIALVYKVNPLFGNLSFGITAGESVAGHQNTAASAQSKAINLGVIGVTLAGEGCKGAEPTLPAEDQPQPVIVGSDDPAPPRARSPRCRGADRCG